MKKHIEQTKWVEKATEIVKLYATNSAVIEKLRSNYEFIVAELKRNLEDNHEKLKQMRINYDNAVEQHEQYLKRQLQTETISHCGISEQNIQNLPANIGLQSSPVETSCSMPEPYTRTELMMERSNFESPVGIHTLEKIIILMWLHKVKPCRKTTKTQNR